MVSNISFILDTPTTPFVAQEQKHQQKEGPRWRSAKLQDFKVGPITSCNK